MKPHPCLTCGACCATFRVSFHWSETLPESFAVPVAMTAPMPPHRQVMNGTDGENPLCGAFKGGVGVGGICSIYENRPGCCRDFKASYEDGNCNESCDRARAGKGLRSLEPADYLQFANPLSDQPGLEDVINQLDFSA